jgi:hypothetical protein
VAAVAAVPVIPPEVRVGRTVPAVTSAVSRAVKIRWVSRHRQGQPAVVVTAICPAKRAKSAKSAGLVKAARASLRTGKMKHHLRQKVSAATMARCQAALAAWGRTANASAAVAVVERLQRIVRVLRVPVAEPPVVVAPRVVVPRVVAPRVVAPRVVVPRVAVPRVVVHKLVAALRAAAFRAQAVLAASVNFLRRATPSVPLVLVQNSTSR